MERRDELLNATAATQMALANANDYFQLCAQLNQVQTGREFARSGTELDATVIKKKSNLRILKYLR